jgi:hypothetical protein
MNYEPNTIKWKPGDIVIHDADAKSEEMLMRVIGYAKDGRCITVYNRKAAMNGENRRRRPTRWENPITHLHDPARFGLKGRTV